MCFHKGHSYSLHQGLNYNETQKEAFKDLSNDTQSLNIGISKKINDNIKLNYNSNLDVKNNYDPYESLFLSLIIIQRYINWIFEY